MHNESDFDDQQEMSQISRSMIADEYEQSMYCQKCKIWLKNYITLKCQHNFCLPCIAYPFLKQQIDVTPLKVSQKVTCSLCYHETYLDQQSIQILDQVLIIIQKDWIDKNYQQEDKIVKNAQVIQSNYHYNTKKNGQSNELQPLPNQCKENSNQIIEFQICDLHPNELQKYFCKTCNCESVCHECIKLTKHNNHVIVSAKEALKQIKPLIKLHLNDQQYNKKNQQNSKIDLQNKLNQIFESLHQQLKLKKVQLLEEIDEILSSDDQKHTLNEEYEKLLKIIANHQCDDAQILNFWNKHRIQILHPDIKDIKNGYLNMEIPNFAIVNEQIQKLSIKNNLLSSESLHDSLNHEPDKKFTSVIEELNQEIQKYKKKRMQIKFENNLQQKIFSIKPKNSKPVPSNINQMTPTKTKKILKFYQADSEKKIFDIETFLSNSTDDLRKNLQKPSQYQQKLQKDNPIYYSTGDLSKLESDRDFKHYVKTLSDKKFNLYKLFEIQKKQLTTNSSTQNLQQYNNIDNQIIKSKSLLLESNSKSQSKIIEQLQNQKQIFRQLSEKYLKNFN